MNTVTQRLTRKTINDRRFLGNTLIEIDTTEETELIPMKKIITESDGGAKTSPSSQPLGTSNQINLEPGSNRSMAIVLITDGQSNMGPDVLKMAELAANHGVKIHTVGVGTEEGTVIKSQGISMRVRLDETLLKKIANATQGEYYKATSNTELKRIKYPKK